jgi:hypothetical protein
MADQQIEALTAITALASGDEFLVNDVSDTTDDANGSPKKVTHASLLNHYRNKNTCGGRLSLESAVSVSSSDQSGKTTIYFVEHTGNDIALYDGTTWNLRTFNNISVAVPSTLFKVFDIFAYDNSGTVTLETTDWNQTTAAISSATTATPIEITTSSAHGFSTGDLIGIAGMAGMTVANGYIWEITVTSSTSFTLTGSVGSGTHTGSTGTAYKIPNTRATALTTQDGVLVKTGATTRRYLGTGMTGGTSGQMDDAVQKRMLYNFYNQVPKHARVNYATSHTYGTNTTRLMNLAAGNKLWYVLGQAQSANVNVFNAASDSLPAVGLGLDATTSETISVFIASQGALSTMGGSYTGTLSAGGHFMAITERAANSTTVTFCVFSTNCRVETVLMM